MKKNLKIILLSAIGLVVLGAVCLVLILTAPKTEEPAETETEASDTAEDTSLTFISRDSSEIQSIAVKNAEDEYTIELASPASTTKDEDGNDVSVSAEYKIEALQKAPLNQATFATTISYACDLSAKTLVEENCEDLSKYGLSTPKAEVTVTATDGTAVSFEVGDDVPTSSTTTYFKLKDSNNVYNVPTYKLSVYLNSRYSYVNTVVMAAYDSEEAPAVVRLTVERMDLDEPIVIEALPEVEEGADLSTFNTHKFVSPVEVMVDANNGQTIVYGMYGLTASQAVWVGMEDKDYEISGLNEPTCTVKMQVGGKTYTLTIGHAVGENTTNDDGTTSTKVTGYYGMFSEVPDVLYLFDVSVLPWLTMDVDSYMARLFMTPYIYSLDSVEFNSAEKNHSYKVEGDADEHKFYVDGDEIKDEDRFKTLYQFFIGAYGEELYTEEALGDYICTITYKYRDTSLPDDVVEIYNSPDDRKIVMRVNGSNLFKCRQIYATRLLENVQAFMDGGEIATTW